MAVLYKSWIIRSLADRIEAGEEFIWPDGFVIDRIDDVLENGTKEMAFITDDNAPANLQGKLVNISFQIEQTDAGEVVMVVYPT